MYLLDTNVCIKLLNNKPSPHLIQKLSERSPKDFRLCSVVKSELWYGAYKSSRRQENLAKLSPFFQQFESMPFDDSAAHRAGEVRAKLDSQGQPIGSNDLLIAAIALANELTLITHNTREFGRIESLMYEDWE